MSDFFPLLKSVLVLSCWNDVSGYSTFMIQLMIKSWIGVRPQAVLKKKSSIVTLQWANPLYPNFACWYCFCIEWNSLVFKMSFLSFVLDKMSKILTIVFVCGTVAVVLSFLLSVREATVCSAQFHNGFKYFLKKYYYFYQHALWQDNCVKYKRIDSCWQHFSSTPTPWLTLLLVLGKSRVKQNSC